MGRLNTWVAPFLWELDQCQPIATLSLVIHRLSNSGVTYLLTCITIGSWATILSHIIRPCTVEARCALMVWLSIVVLLNSYRRSHKLRFIFLCSLLCYNIASSETPPLSGQAGGGLRALIRSYTIIG
jgi:hypothetical protein